MNCPSCGAAIGSGDEKCGYCGASLSHVRVDREVSREACRRLIQSLEEDLKGLSTNPILAGFGIGIVLTVAAFVLVKYLGGSTLTAVILTVLVGGGGLILAGSILQMEQRRHFKKIIRPQIEKFLLSNDMTREEFMNLSGEILEKGSALKENLGRLYQ